MYVLYLQFMYAEYALIRVAMHPSKWVWLNYICRCTLLCMYFLLLVYKCMHLLTRVYGIYWFLFALKLLLLYGTSYLSVDISRGMLYLGMSHDIHVIVMCYSSLVGDLEFAEEKYEKAKQELDSTLAELGDM